MVRKLSSEYRQSTHFRASKANNSAICFGTFYKALNGNLLQKTLVASRNTINPDTIGLIFNTNRKWITIAMPDQEFTWNPRHVTSTLHKRRCLHVK